MWEKSHNFVILSILIVGWEIFDKKLHTASVRCIKYVGDGMVAAGSDDNTMTVSRNCNKI